MSNETEVKPEVELAKLFHDAYERLAPDFGYTTRSETRQWDAESANGRLMTAVVKEVLLSRQGLDLRTYLGYEAGQQYHESELTQLREREAKLRAAWEQIESRARGCRDRGLAMSSTAIQSIAREALSPTAETQEEKV